MFKAAITELLRHIRNEINANTVENERLRAEVKELNKKLEKINLGQDMIYDQLRRNEEREMKIEQLKNLGDDQRRGDK